MDRPKHISASQLKTWISCPWRYHLRYGLGLLGEETEAIRRGKEIHETLFATLSGLSDWSQAEHPFHRILKSKFKYVPQVEPTLYDHEGGPVPRLAIPDLVSAPEELVADLKTVTQPHLIHTVYEADYLQMAFYRLVMKYPRYYILKLYPEADGSWSHRWHYIPPVKEHEQLLLQTEREEIVAYWEGSLKPTPKFESCRFCSFKEVCTWYQEVSSSERDNVADGL